MKKSWYLVGWAVLMVVPGIAQAQHGGHNSGHASGMAPAHFYGGAGGMNVPPPMHFSPPPMHMPASPPMHHPTAPPIHLPVDSGPNMGPHIQTAHVPAANVPNAGLPGSKVVVGAHASGGGVSGSNPAASIEAARMAALEARYLSAPWLYGYPGYYDYYGLSGIPYYYGANLPYGYGYGVYRRPYYYGYLSGVPYINSNNYSPVYYSLYNDLPSITGSVTTQSARGTTASQAAERADASSSLDPFTNFRSEGEITAEQARAALVQAEQNLAEGKYQLAVQNAGKAAMQLHEESQVHEVLWLALMGLADYRGAAIEAHAVDHFGVTPNWNDIAMKHADPTRFNEQMKKLETFVHRNKDSDFAAFLLGYNYLVLGHKDAARQWLEVAAKMDPQDVLCSKLVKSLQADTNTTKPAVGILPGDAAPAG